MNDVNKNTKSHISKIISILGFMDDTNWILSSLENLKQILSVADKFYDIIRAAINKDKLKLLTNTIQESDSLPVQFGKTQILIMLSTEIVYFLEVNININLNHSLIIKELKAYIR